MKSSEIAQDVLKKEAQAITDQITQINKNFDHLIEQISCIEGKLIVAGVGKSGHVGRKIAATLSSTGTPSFFVHPTEGSHGDLGMISKGDMVLAISFSGNASELNDLLKYCSRRAIKVIGLTGHAESVLAKHADYNFVLKVKEEACPMGLAPTTSTTATLAVGDAIAMALLDKKGFKKEDFAEFHPGGKLGKKLLTRIEDVMHQKDEVALIDENTPILAIVEVMTDQNIRGLAGVVRGEKLIGAITDGDIRRSLKKENFSLELTAKHIMSERPVTVEKSLLAEKALQLMDEKKIQFLFVTDSSDRVVGATRFHDLIAIGLR